MMPESTGLIEVIDITKTYDRRVALKEVSLSFKEERIIGIIGPDGAGKTTLLEIIVGLRNPDSGEVKFRGKTWKEASTSLKRTLGFVPQDFSLYADLTVEENLLFFGQIYGTERKRLREKIEELLEVANLKEARNRPSGKLSGGMKQKLMVLTSLVHEPSLLILDEPSRGVDPISRAELWHLIHFVKEQGTTVILSTSNIEEVSEMDEVVFLNHGEVLVQVEVENLRKLFPFKVMEIQTDNPEYLVERIEKINDIKAIHRVGSRVRVYFAIEDEEVVKDWMQFGERWSWTSPTPEDIFVYLSGGFSG